MAETAIVTEGLTKYYDGRRGIVDVALEVRAGEVHLRRPEPGPDPRRRPGGPTGEHGEAP